MIDQLVSELFERIGHVWKIGGKYRAPTEQDVQQVLDKAAVTLYDRNQGDRVEVAGLLIEKATTGYDVYAYVGTYQ